MIKAKILNQVKRSEIKLNQMKKFMLTIVKGTIYFVLIFDT